MPSQHCWDLPDPSRVLVLPVPDGPPDDVIDKNGGREAGLGSK